MQVAAQLDALMKRHGLVYAVELADIMKKKGTPIDYTTINRMLLAKAKTEPRPENLRAIAAAVGEDFDEAFPDKPQIIAEIDGRRIAFRALDNKPFSPSLLEKISKLGDTSATLAGREYAAGNLSESTSTHGAERKTPRATHLGHTSKKSSGQEQAKGKSGR